MLKFKNLNTVRSDEGVSRHAAQRVLSPFKIQLLIFTAGEAVGRHEDGGWRYRTPCAAKVMVDSAKRGKKKKEEFFVCGCFLRRGRK